VGLLSLRFPFFPFSASWLTFGISIRFGMQAGAGDRLSIRDSIGILSSTAFGNASGRWRVIQIIRIVCRRHTPITGFDCFEPESSFRALCRLPLQNVVKEVFYGTLVHVPWVSEFEPGWEMFRINEYRRLIGNCFEWDMATTTIVC
jgi:hypothetical protein